MHKPTKAMMAMQKKIVAQIVAAVAAAKKQ